VDFFKSRNEVSDDIYVGDRLSRFCPPDSPRTDSSESCSLDDWSEGEAFPDTGPSGNTTRLLQSSDVSELILADGPSVARPELPAVRVFIDSPATISAEEVFSEECVVLKSLKRSRSFFSFVESGFVLIVDDNAVCRKALIRTVEHLGYKYETANDGREACNLVERNPSKYSVIMMDFRMPNMDGLEASTYIKYILKSNIPIIILTGETLETAGVTATQVRASGINDYLVKPVKIEDVNKTFLTLGVGVEVIKWKDGSKNSFQFSTLENSHGSLELLRLCELFDHNS